MKRRHAYSLVEMVVAIGLTAVTLSVTAMTMHSLHRAEHRIRDDFQQQRTLKRLATQLRQDAHEASSAVVMNDQDPNNPAARQVTLAVSDGKSIRYAVHTDRIEREVLKESGVEHRETFRLLGPDSRWAVQELDGRTIVTLHLIHVEQQQSAVQDVPNLEIHAAVSLSAAVNREQD